MLRYVLALVALILQSASPASSQSRSGRDMLRFLEGRWTSSDCSRLYTEFSFSQSKHRALRMKWGPDYGDRRLNVEIEYDTEGDLVLYFPSINHRTVVVFIDADLRETTDIAGDGAKTKTIWKRCSLPDVG